MGVRRGKVSARSPSSLQRGPARRPGWASPRLVPALSSYTRLQRGPARRPGWAVAEPPQVGRRRVAASTRPGPEAGMGAYVGVPGLSALFELQRGPARRPGWAMTISMGLDGGLTGLQRGPARRPGWAAPSKTDSPAPKSLQRGPARRPGWALPPRARGRLRPEASTRPGPEAGMGGASRRRLSPMSCRFNEARPGGRDGRSGRRRRGRPG